MNDNLAYTIENPDPHKLVKVTAFNINDWYNVFKVFDGNANADDWYDAFPEELHSNINFGFNWGETNIPMVIDGNLWIGLMPKSSFISIPSTNQDRVYVEFLYKFSLPDLELLNKWCFQTEKSKLLRPTLAFCQKDKYIIEPYDSSGGGDKDGLRIALRTYDTTLDENILVVENIFIIPTTSGLFNLQFQVLNDSDNVAKFEINRGISSGNPTKTIISFDVSNPVQPVYLSTEDIE